MKTVSVTISGITPLLQHRFPLEPVEYIEKKSKEEQAEIAAYRIPTTNGEKGNLYIPGSAIQRMLIAGATFQKGKGRSTLKGNAAACLLVTPEYCDLGISDYVIDARPVVVPATKGRVVRYRPRLDAWSVKFELEWDETLLTEQQVRRIVDDGGKRVGLLDFRPAKNGSFGRFVVNGWNS